MTTSEDHMAAQSSRLKTNELLPTTYISGHDWPPFIYHEEYGRYECPTNSDGWLSLPSRTYETTIGDTTYCVTVVSEGAAGSSYDTYSYTTVINDKLYRLWFTLRSVQCGGYADSVEPTRCQNERDNFQIDEIIHELLQSSLTGSTNFIQYGSISGGPNLVSTVIDSITLQPTDQLPRSIVFGSETKIISDISFTSNKKLASESSADDSLSLTITTSDGELIRYFYSPDTVWQPEFVCAEDTRCGNADSGALSLWQRTVNRSATKSDLRLIYPNETDDTLNQWLSQEYVVTIYYKMKVHSFFYDANTNDWHSLRLTIEELMSAHPPDTTN